MQYRFRLPGSFVVSGDRGLGCGNQERKRLFFGDLLAGITIGLAALPLEMAFAVPSGVSPEAGLYTAIVASFTISVLGGSKTQMGDALLDAA